MNVSPLSPDQLASADAQLINCSPSRSAEWQRQVELSFEDGDDFDMAIRKLRKAGAPPEAARLMLYNRAQQQLRQDAQKGVFQMIAGVLLLFILTPFVLHPSALSGKMGQRMWMAAIVGMMAAGAMATNGFISWQKGRKS